MKFLNVEFSEDICVDGKTAPTASMQILNPFTLLTLLISKNGHFTYHTNKTALIKPLSKALSFKNVCPR